MADPIKTSYKISGMHCAACELLVEKRVAKIEGVQKVDAKLSSSTIDLVFDSNVNEKHLIGEINGLIEQNGYLIVDEGVKNEINWREIGLALLIATIFVSIFFLLEKAGLTNVLNFEEGKLPLTAVFLVGVVASLSTCMAIVGGIVLTISSNYAKVGANLPLILFHISRIVGFFVLGGVIGLVGSLFKLSTVSNLVIQVLLFLVMLLIGLSQLNLFPWLNKFQLRAPKKLGKKVDSVSNYTNAIIPMALGVLTFVLPCGFTQSMQFYALSTGSFIEGALTMFVFSLGTLPVLGLISFASVKLAKSLQSSLFFKTAGFLIIFLAIFNLVTVISSVIVF